MWNRRGQHSSAQASNKDPNSYRNNPNSRWDCKPIRHSWAAASLKVDNQCLCEADANRLKPEQVHRAALSPAAGAVCTQSAKTQSAKTAWRHWIIWDKYHHHHHLHQCWIIRATCVFYWWITDVHYLLFKLDLMIKLQQLFGIAWEWRVSADWEVGRSYSFFSDWESSGFVFRECRQHERMLTFFSTDHSGKRCLNDIQIKSKS